MAERIYRTVRFFRDHEGATRRGRKLLTLDEARAHCRNPETSSSTATSDKAQALTRAMGPWFDGYEVHPKFSKREK